MANEAQRDPQPVEVQPAKGGQAAHEQERGGLPPIVKVGVVFVVFAGALSLLMFGSGVLGNDTDADADTLSAILVSGPAHGTLTLNADGGFTYTPGQNFNGEDSFSYRASDGVADSNQATVTITVAALNDAPVTADDSNAASDDGVAATGNLLANDGDVDGDTLAVGIGPYSLTYGQLELDADGNYSYLVTDQSLGVGDERTDTFTYLASDGTTSTPGQITFQVSGANEDEIIACPSTQHANTGRLASRAGRDDRIVQACAAYPVQSNGILG